MGIRGRPVGTPTRDQRRPARLPLCGSESGELVVIELKRGKTSDRVVGQAARYIGWVKHHLAKPGQPVRGLIVAHEHDDRLAYAVAAVPDLAVMTYDIEFTLSLT